MTNKIKYQITNQRELRCLFWDAFPGADKRKVGKNRDFTPETRELWVNWIDELQKDGQISEALASRVTLG